MENLIPTSVSSKDEIQPVWRPTIDPSHIPINQYRDHINSKFGLSLCNSRDLHQWSVSDPQAFWVDLWSYVGIIPELPRGTNLAYDCRIPITEVPRFFEGARINYAENVLTQPEVDPHSPALIGIREGENLDGQRLTWAELREKVRKIQSALRRSGVQEGDRVGALISTSIWSVAIFLASASIGAIFTSIASDLGEKGSSLRLREVCPKILFVDSHVTYKGQKVANLDKVSAILDHIHHKPEVVVLPLHTLPAHQFLDMAEFLSRTSSSDPLTFKRLPFSAPLYILYSSGTSGPPKCLVHQHGVILQHKKVSKLHNSLKPGEVVLQYSSTSWVLWNIMVGHLSVGTTLVLYDGSPTYPSARVMLEIVERHRVAYWGASPKFLQALQSTEVIAKDEYDLSSLRMVQSGGSHLAADQYYWFYRAFPKAVHLTSVTGGTDIVTSWIGTDPAGPLFAGELQLPILGHDIDVVDPVTGESVKDRGIAGEFICRQPFPSMPVFFWGDKDNKQYKSSYFDRFEFPCWTQHDWISFNPLTGGSQVHGRSDGVLNPQGVRFGSAEIYSITEAEPFNKSIEATLCIGRRREALDKDEAVFLFVVMRPGHSFDRPLRSLLRRAIRDGLSPRHVPRFIFEVKEVPMTVNGKKVETLVKQTICTGDLPKRISTTVVNPQCLQDFQKYYSIEQPQMQARL